MNAPVMNAEEREVMDHILAAYNGIREFGPGLSANSTELTQAVHTLQGFVIQRMLARVAPDVWGDWYQGSPTSRSF